MYLDELPMVSHTVGWGEVGMHGELGWDARKARVDGHTWLRSLSAHAHSSLVYDLAGLPSFDLLNCRVALCDSAFGKGQYPTANFEVIVDGIKAAAVTSVHNSKPRMLTANIQGAKRLELRVTCPTFEHCHSIWIDPQLETWPEGGVLDPLGQVRIHRPDAPIIADRCIVAMASPGFARWLDIFFTSLKSNGGCQSAERIVFLVDEDADCDAVIASHGARTVHCTALAPRSSTLRPAVFSIGSVARFNKAIVCETDMIVLQNIGDLWDAIDVCADPTLLVAREQHRNVPYKLEEFFSDIYQGTYDELVSLRVTEREKQVDLQINGGIIAGSAEAVAALDHTMRDFLPYSKQWVQSRRDMPYREMFIINAAMARLNNCIRLDPAYNVQMLKGCEKRVDGAFPPQVEFRGDPVKVLHFSERKQAYPALQSYYWRHGNPDQKLSEGLAAIRSAPLNSLRDAGFVVELIRQIGLQESHWWDAALLYGDDAAYMNTGPGLFQIPGQLAAALVHLSDKQIRSYAEVGVYHGWTFAFLTAYLSRFTELERAVAIDIEDQLTAYYHILEHYPIEFVHGDSSNCEAQPFDLVFIDGNHSYAGANEDWERLGKHARWCMFHDINDTLVEQSFPGSSVRKLWGELSGAHSGSVEFLDHTKEQQVMGIGVLCTTGIG